MLRHNSLDFKVDRSVEISLLKIVRPAGSPRSWQKKDKNRASAGNRTREACVACEHSTTEPPMLRHKSLDLKWMAAWKFRRSKSFGQLAEKR
ncbi:hypothetical protein CEXT_44861 [Caerostris extrusa]|uniref:Uncharacterized protein n=1 Tax=Caerostris extrusa TaxID=172846 RepID=A0AAV4TQS2_CAEEX|nr:hypothetical protein CEXT_44861 [Caerostris extrusa]